jgi:hypothetical protein
LIFEKQTYKYKKVLAMSYQEAFKKRLANAKRIVEDKDKTQEQKCEAFKNLLAKIRTIVQADIIDMAVDIESWPKVHVLNFDLSNSMIRVFMPTHYSIIKFVNFSDDIETPKNDIPESWYQPGYPYSQLYHFCVNIKRDFEFSTKDFKYVLLLVCLYKSIELELKETKDALEEETEYKDLFGIEVPADTDPPITAQTESKTNKVNTGKSQRYTFDTAKISAVYDFCIETKVFNSSDVTEVDFIKAVDSADFRSIHAESEKTKGKSRCKYIIYVLSKFISGDNWYLNTAHSINTEPNKCSGITVPSEWKKKVNDIK